MAFDDLYRKYTDYYYYLEKYKPIILNGRDDKNLLIKTMDELYVFLKRIAPLFFRNNQYAEIELYRDLVYEVDAMECCLPECYFILPSNPDYKFIGKKPEMPHTGKSEDILDWLVYMVRTDYAYVPITDKIKSLDSLSMANECFNASIRTQSLCFQNGLDCHIIEVTPGFCHDTRLHDGTDYHYACVVIIDEVPYLVDCTYRQFFMTKWNTLERLGVPFLNGTKPGIFMLMTKEREDLAKRILKRGWIEFTDQNVKAYFDGFALSYRNGLYYDETDDYSYTTPYNATDYDRFLSGADSQLNHEGMEVMMIQNDISRKRLK